MARIKVTVRDNNRIPEVIADLKKINGKKVRVGYKEGTEMAKIAGVHEFGMNIRPKNGKYLAIPTKKAGLHTSPRDHADLFFIPTDNGNGLLAKERGKDAFDVYFVLVKSVKIPERSFLRTGTDLNIGKIQKKAEELLPQVVAGNVSVDLFYQMLGLELKGKITEHAIDLDNPPNAHLTKENKGSSNPLVDTGGMLQALEVEVD